MALPAHTARAEPLTAGTEEAFRAHTVSLTALAAAGTELCVPGCARVARPRPCSEGQCPAEGPRRGGRSSEPPRVWERAAPPAGTLSSKITLVPGPRRGPEAQE